MFELLKQADMCDIYTAWYYA